MSDTDLRVQKTKKILKDKFKEMFLEMDYSKITIKELCERSSINRRTFYLHYDTIEDLLLEVLEELAVDFFNYTNTYDHFTNPERIVKDYFYFSNNNKLFEKINHDTDYLYIKNLFTDKLFDADSEANNKIFKSVVNLSPFKRAMLASYLNGATVAMYRTWYNNGKKVPIDDAIKMASSLIKIGLSL